MSGRLQRSLLELNQLGRRGRHDRQQDVESLSLQQLQSRLPGTCLVTDMIRYWHLIVTHHAQANNRRFIPAQVLHE